MYRNMDDPSYVPRTVCMDEVVPGEVYELVPTVLRGGRLCQVPGGGYVPVPGACQQGRRDKDPTV